MKTSLNYLFLFLTILASCNQSDRFKVNIKANDTTVYHVRFDKLMGKGPNSTFVKTPETLRNENPVFFDLYTSRIINIGRFNDPEFLLQAKLFASDSIYLMVFDSVQHTFKNGSEVEKNISEGLIRFHHFFPTKDLPKVYYYISGFNESVMLAEGILGLS